MEDGSEWMKQDERASDKEHAPCVEGDVGASSGVSVYTKKGSIPCGMSLVFRLVLVCFSYANLAMCEHKLDFKLAALLAWMMLVFANLSSIF